MPFGFNLAGKSLYLYINLGDKDLIFGASMGVSHNAFADAYDDSQLMIDSGYDYPGDTYGLGPIDLVIESNDELQLFRFGLMAESDYLGFEFPWLFLPAIFTGLGVWRYRASRRKVVG